MVSQLQSGPGPLPTSSSTVTTGDTLSTDHAGDILRPRPHPFLSSASDPSLLPHYVDVPVWRSKDSVDHQKCRMFAQEEAVGRGKRKLASPEGGVRQSALPQPQTGRERRRQEEEEEEQQQNYIRQGGVKQNSEKHMNQGEGQNQDCQKSRTITGGKNIQGSI